MAVNSSVVIAVGVVFICILSSYLPFGYALLLSLGLAGYCLMFRTNHTTTSNTSYEESEDSQNKRIAKLTRENDNYRQERDHNLQKLSTLESLKEENENLKRQVERQTSKAEQFLYKLDKLEKIDDKHYMEKKNIEEEIYLEKRKCRERIEEMEKVVERYRQNNEQLKFQQERESDMFRAQYTEIQGQLQMEQQQKEAIRVQACMEIDKLRKELETGSRRMMEIENGYRQALRKSEEKQFEIEGVNQRYKDEIKKGKENTRKLSEQQKEIEELRGLVEAQAQTSREPSIPHCNICEERSKDTCLDPCGHTLCMVCATEITSRNNKCPVCRKHIHKTTRLFFS